MGTPEDKVANVREGIARIVNSAKYRDGISIAWESCTSYERDVALDKVDQILSYLKSQGWRDSKKFKVLSEDSRNRLIDLAGKTRDDIDLYDLCRVVATAQLEADRKGGN